MVKRCNIALLWMAGFNQISVKFLERLGSSEKVDLGGCRAIQGLPVLHHSNLETSPRRKKDMLTRGRNLCRKFENRGLDGKVLLVLWGASKSGVSEVSTLAGL